MNLKTRLTVNFMSQVFLLFGIVCALGIVFVVYVTEVGVGGGAGTNPILITKSMPSETTITNGQVAVSPLLRANVKELGGWMQVLNGQGNEVYEYQRPSRIPTKYPPGLLLEYHAYPERYGYMVYSWYDKVDGQNLTWLLGVPYTDASSLIQFEPYVLMVVVFIASVFAAVVISLLFGRRMGAPLLHMMNWLQRLANGQYEEPMDAKGIRRSHLANGHLRRTFRLYREVIDGLEQLSDALQSASKERKRLEFAREEWITGVSHDIKTPLSSVRGYGDLLATSQYHWSSEEVRNFGKIIVEKSVHMEGLIEDLGLAFRLKNEGIPLVRVPMNVVEVVRRVVIDVVNRPDMEERDVSFQTKTAHVVYPLDEKWFARALDNLLWNAVVHNPSDTKICVELDVDMPPEGKSYPGLCIQVRDDGIGMDEQTIQHLFDRYYRGTNTSEKHSKGSGLGCAIAKQLIEAHGGTVHVESELGQGTVFIIKFPSV